MKSWVRRGLGVDEKIWGYILKTENAKGSMLLAKMTKHEHRNRNPFFASRQNQQR